MSSAPETYLAICTIYRNDAEYLREWIEFHRLVGAERFFLYNNDSDDAHREILGPYVEAGLVSLADWPRPIQTPAGTPTGAAEAFTDCIARHRNTCRWIAFLDIDEFLFSPRTEDVTSVLTEFEAPPGLAVPRYDFGPSGNVQKPDGLVIESYQERAAVVPEMPVPYKSVVQPARTRGCIDFHRFLYRDGQAVNENGWAVGTGTSPECCPPYASRLRINHYGTRSEAEMHAKDDVWEAAGRGRPKQRNWVLKRASGVVQDDSISAYVRPLRRRLELLDDG